MNDHSCRLVRRAIIAGNELLLRNLSPRAFSRSFSMNLNALEEREPENLLFEFSAIAEGIFTDATEADDTMLAEFQAEFRRFKESIGALLAQSSRKSSDCYDLLIECCEQDVNSREANSHGR